MTQETEGNAASAGQGPDAQLDADGPEPQSAGGLAGQATMTQTGLQQNADLPPGATTGPDGITRVPGRLGQVVSDMVRTMVVIGAVVAVIVLITLRPSPDPVRQIEAEPIATAVQAAVDYPVVLPSIEDWRATSARWEATSASEDTEVWFAGGVLADADQFLSVSQSPVFDDDYLQEQTGGFPTDETFAVADREWVVYRGEIDVAAVNRAGGVTTVVRTNTGIDRLPEFVASLDAIG